MARIAIDENGEGTLILWNKVTDPEWPLAEASVSDSDSGSDIRRLQSLSGRFSDMDLGAADWFIAPDDMGYEDMIYIQGTYVDPADSSSTYGDQFILRPWGTDWSDFAADYPDGLPYCYKDWYLPATRAGISTPDAIGGGSFSAPGEVPDEEMEGQG